MNDSAIFEACRKGDLEEVKRLYASDKNVINAYDFKGFTPLILAVYNQSQDVVEFLLEKGADPNAKDAAYCAHGSGLQGVYRPGRKTDSGRS
jgi:uncharacterized protein